jgi:antibiotic biosynthesis monooxygenase (ABM) superfamily enzyme
MPIHIAITRQVRPGCDAEFQPALRGFSQASFAHGGVYPTSLALLTFAAPHLHGSPRPLTALVTGICMVLCLTWVVMPHVTKLLHRWLHPPSPLKETSSCIQTPPPT